MNPGRIKCLSSLYSCFQNSHCFSEAKRCGGVKRHHNFNLHGGRKLSAASQSDCGTAAPAGGMLHGRLSLPLCLCTSFPDFREGHLTKFKLQIHETYYLTQLSEVQFICLCKNILLHLKGERPWENYIEYDLIWFIFKCECTKSKSQMPTTFDICLYPNNLLSLFLFYFIFFGLVVFAGGCVSSQQMT